MVQSVIGADCQWIKGSDQARSRMLHTSQNMPDSLNALNKDVWNAKIRYFASETKKLQISNRIMEQLAELFRGQNNVLIKHYKKQEQINLVTNNTDNCIKKLCSSDLNYYQTK